jgi:hypothetical protein
MLVDLRDQLRLFIDAAADPISRDEIETLPRTITLDDKADSRRRGASRVVAAAAAVALVVLAAGLVSRLEPGPGGDGTSTTDPTVQPLIAAFDWDYDPTQNSGTACSFGTTYLLDRSEGEPTGWLWQFPDGSTSTEQHPIVPSSQTVGPGVGYAHRTVTLTVYRDGRSASTKRFVAPTHC